MVKTKIESINPETKEAEENTFESGAVCAVFVTDKGDGSAEVIQSIIGETNINTAGALIHAILESCNHILRGIDPMLAKIILAIELEKVLRKGEENVAGTSDESERPAEQ